MNKPIVLLFILALTGCAADHDIQLPDPVGHVVDVNARPWSVDLAPDVKIVRIVPPTRAPREQFTRTADAAAFVLPRADNSEPQIEYVYFTHGADTYRVEGLPLGHRPISDLLWATPRYLTFDRWSQPHYGMHYVIDADHLALVNATPFPDQFFLDQQKDSSPVRLSSWPSGYHGSTDESTTVRVR